MATSPRRTIPQLHEQERARILAEITTAAGRGWAWMYVLLSSELAHGAPVIADGDWAGYRPRRG